MLYAIVVFLGVMADQLTKLWVSGSLMGEGVVRVIPGLLISDMWKIREWRSA